MTEKTDQADVVAALGDQWKAIDALLGDLEEPQWRLPVPLPEWDVHATVAHLIGGESHLLDIAPPTDEKIVAGHVRNPLGEHNEQWVRGLAHLDGEQMAARWREVTDLRRAALSALTAEQWAAPVPRTPMGSVPYGRFMTLRLFDCWMHELDIRDAVGRPGDEGDAISDRVVTHHIVPALGHTVGGRGKAPKGSRVALRLTGPLTRDVFVDVGERARVVDALEGPATVGITLDSRLFVRLFGGRTHAAKHADAISVTGDEALGRHLLDNFATTP